MYVNKLQVSLQIFRDINVFTKNEEIWFDEK